MEGAILTNPCSPDDMDRGLEEGMQMSADERAARLLRLRQRVVSHDVHQWSRSFLRDAERAGAPYSFISRPICCWSKFLGISDLARAYFKVISQACQTLRPQRRTMHEPSLGQ